MAEWQLFVDESGDFGKNDDIVCVAGFLLPAAADMGAGNLRHALAQLAPAMPWPPHTAHLSKPSMWLLSAHVEAECRGVAPESDVVAATAMLKGAHPVATAEAIRRLRRGKRPAIDLLRALDQHLRSADRVLFQRWVNRGRTALTAMRVVTAATVAFARGIVGAPLPALVAAGEAAIQGEGDRHDLQRTSRRYLGLLDALLSHLRSVVGGNGDRHVVHIHVLERDIYDEQRRASMPLRPQNVRDLPAVADVSDSVTLIVDATPAYDYSTHPALVLADFVAFSTRRVLHPAATLQQVEERLRRETRLPVRSGMPSRSHLSARQPETGLIQIACVWAVDLAAAPAGNEAAV
jgi:hypothetical protein